MAGVYCARCKTNVILEADGRCSNCKKQLIPKADTRPTKQRRTPEPPTTWRGPAGVPPAPQQKAKPPARR